MSLTELKETYIELDKERFLSLRKNQVYKQEIPQLGFFAENMDEHAKNIEALQSKVARLQAQRQNLRLGTQNAKKNSTQKSSMLREILDSHSTL
ncbi:MAG: hypothetical protein LBH79_04020 [Nitrososphaerota archaeon]|nr:hypothetical protein [Nitrososphaerota archaeon]